MLKRWWIAVVSLLPIASGARGDVRGDFLKMIDRPRVAADVEMKAMAGGGALEIYHFTYAVDAADRVPGLLMEAAGEFAGRRPVIIALHGTGGNKSDELPLMRQLAARGFIVVAIDTPYHGERSRAGRGTVDYNAAIVRAWHDPEHREHPFYFDTVWDVMRLIDYLQTRPDVDPGASGCTEFPKGGSRLI